MDNNPSAAEQQGPPPAAVIMQIASGAMFTQALGVAAELRVADLIHEGRASVNEIASETGSHARSLYRLLRSLASVGVFRETAHRTFENTPTSELLRSGTSDSMRNTALFMAASWHYDVWAEMKHSVMTGKTAWEKTYGTEVFEWLADRQPEAEIFNNCMTELSVGAAAPVVEAYDFSGIETVADIAGGHGYLLSQILREYPQLRGILFDMDHVLAAAGRLLEERGVDGRVEKVSGDFFKEVPPANAYIMKHIIHDWDDERSVLILKNIHRSMIGDGRVLIVEMVVPEGNEPHPSKALDLEMLSSPGGLERTEAEYGDLYAAAGFRLNRIVATGSPFSVIEGLKA